MDIDMGFIDFIKPFFPLLLLLCIFLSIMDTFHLWPWDKEK